MSSFFISSLPVPLSMDINSDNSLPLYVDVNDINDSDNSLPELNYDNVDDVSNSDSEEYLRGILLLSEAEML